MKGLDRPSGPYRDWVIWAERGVGTTQAVVEEVASWAPLGEIRSALFVCVSTDQIKEVIRRFISIDGSIEFTASPVFRIRFRSGMQIRFTVPDMLRYGFQAESFDAAVIEDLDLIDGAMRAEESVNRLLSRAEAPRRIFTFKLAPGWPVKRLFSDGVLLTVGRRSIEPVSDGKVSPEIEGLLEREGIVRGCRFTARRKIYLIQALDRSEDAAQAVLKARFGLNEIELAEWRDRLNRDGQVGLKASSVRDPDHRLT